MQTSHVAMTARCALRLLLLSSALWVAGCSTAPTNSDVHRMTNTPQQVTLPGGCAIGTPTASTLTRADVIRALTEHGMVFAQRGQSTQLLIPVDRWFNVGTANWHPHRSSHPQPAGWSNLVLLLKSYTITELDVSVVASDMQRPGGMALHQAQADAVAQALLADGVRPPFLTTHARANQSHRMQSPHVVLHFHYAPLDTTS